MCLLVVLAAEVFRGHAKGDRPDDVPKRLSRDTGQQHSRRRTRHKLLFPSRSREQLHYASEPKGRQS